MKNLIVVSLFLVLSGCMTVNEGLIRKVDVPEASNKNLLVEIKPGELVQKLNGQGVNQGVLSGTTVLNAISKSMVLKWKQKGLISDYGFAGDLEANPDYTLLISGTKNEDANMTAAFLSGMALMLIPTTSTLTYDLDAELIDNKTGKHYKSKAKNAVTTWVQILLFPAIPFAWIGTDNMIGDMSMFYYDDFKKQGAFSR
jgi:cell division protein YceG involved in septum cleavage